MSCDKVYRNVHSSNHATKSETQDEPGYEYEEALKFLPKLMMGCMLWDTITGLIGMSLGHDAADFMVGIVAVILIISVCVCIF